MSLEKLQHARATVNIDGMSIELRSLSAGEVSYLLDEAEGFKQQVAFVAACCSEPRMSKAEVECLPFPVFTRLVAKAMELNGLDDSEPE